MNIAVIGIGNLLLSDEGVGVRVVEQLKQQYCFPSNVVILAGETAGLDLITVLSGREKLLVVDAASGGQPPGSIYKFDLANIYCNRQTNLSLHELGIAEVLQTLAMLGKPAAEVVFVGIEPASLEFGLQLSPIVEDKISCAMEAVLQQLAEWGVTAVPVAAEAAPLKQ